MAIVPIRNLGGGGGESTSSKKYLYKNGNEYAEFTGGLSNSGFSLWSNNLSSPSKSATSIATTSYGNCSTQFFGTQNKIDLSGYSKLVASVIGGNFSANYNYSFRLFDTKSNIAKTLKFGNVTSGTIEIDISSENGSYYICQYPDYTTSNNSVVFDKIWLE